MSDIVDRIKALRYVHVPQASLLFEEAAAEIARLRLTDAEREAVEDGIRCCEYMAAYKPTESRANLVASVATLRGLLERLG